MTALHILQRPNRGGKTYEALKWLHDKGGGVFVTTEPEHIIMPYIENFKFENITVMRIHAETPIAIDNADNRDTFVTITLPASLTWKEL